MKAILADASSIPQTKQILLNAFRRRIDSLNIMRQRVIQRFALSLIEVIF